MGCAKHLKFIDIDRIRLDYDQTKTNKNPKDPTKINSINTPGTRGGYDFSDRMLAVKSR